MMGGANSLTRADWQPTLSVNLLAPFFWAQGLLPELEAAKGSIVNISSIHARLTKKNFVAYATSKEALSAQLEQCHPLGRIGLPAEVAKCVLNIVQGGLDFLSGTCVALDGGISAVLHDPQ